MFYSLKTFFGQHYVTYLSVLIIQTTRSIEKIDFFKNFEIELFFLVFFRYFIVKI